LKYEKLVYPEIMLLFLFNCPSLKFEGSLSAMLLLFRGTKLNFLNIESCWLFGELLV